MPTTINLTTHGTEISSRPISYIAEIVSGGTILSDIPAGTFVWFYPTVVSNVSDRTLELRGIASADGPSVIYANVDAAGDAAGTSDPLDFGSPMDSAGFVREALGSGYVYKATRAFDSLYISVSGVTNSGVALAGRMHSAKPTTTTVTTAGTEVFNVSSRGTPHTLYGGKRFTNVVAGTYFWFYPTASRTISNREITVIENIPANTVIDFSSGVQSGSDGASNADPIDFGVASGVGVTREVFGSGYIYKTTHAYRRLYIGTSATYNLLTHVSGRWAATPPTTDTLSTHGTQMWSRQVELAPLDNVSGGGELLDVPAGTYFWFHSSAVVNLTNRVLELRGTYELEGLRSFTGVYTVASGDTAASGDLKYDITNESLVTDEAGNAIASVAATAIANTAIDTTAPTISSAVSNGAGKVVITLSENVWAATAPTAADFSITGGGAPTITSVTGVAGTIATADDAFVLNLSTALSGAATVSYTQNSGRLVKDIADNDLASASSVSITAGSLTVSPISGGYVNDTEDESAVTVSGTSSNIVDGITVTVDLDGSGTDVSKTATISSNAWSTTITSAQMKALASDGDTVTVTATTDHFTGTGSFVYDTSAPTITTTVAGTVIARTVSAADNDSGTTTMLYKLIDGTDTCDATEMASDTESYTEGSSKTITGAANNGKKACFSSTDVAGNTNYTATAALAVAGDAPSTVWTPANNGYLTSLSGSITLVFGTDVYSDSGCATELTNTTADNAVTLGTTNANNNIATTVTYTAATNTITITPDADLTDNTTYHAGVTNAWYYQNGACAQGVAESISFTTDATAPTVSSIAYNDSADGTGNTLTNLPLTGTVYSIVTFSEPITQVVANDSTARPEIVYKTSSSASETQYTIIASGTLSSGDCKNIGTNANTNKIYSCRYTGSGLSGSNLFKTYITTYTDEAGNSGVAQSYTTNAGGVTFSTNAAPSFTYSPANNAHTNDNTTNITITATSTLYKDSSGTSFSNTDIDDIITLKEDDSSGDAIAFGATISGNVITIDPDSNLEDGTVYVALSNGWYYGVNPTKTQGSTSSSSFVVDTAAPTLTISTVSGGYVNASEDDSGVTVSGTTTGANAGSDVDLTFTNGSNTTSINDIAVSSNAWTTTLTLTQLTALTEGTISISGTVDDHAGNTATATQSFVYDITNPTITTTVAGTNDNRTVSATDNESGTTMERKIITSGTTCNASTMSSGTTAYTEGGDITIAAADNGKKVCFSSTDAAGNSTYTATAALVTGSGLTATVGSIPTGSAKSKDITISSVTTGAAVKYKIITNSTCNATNYGTGGTTVTLSSNAGTVTVTNELDNAKYLCFKVTKTNFSDHYVASAQITGIDDTAPTAPSAITNKTTSPNNDTTPTFTVTVAETGGSVILYSDSSCTSANAVSSATNVTDNTSPYKVDVTTNAYSTDGTKTVYAQHTDEATNTSSCSTATGTYTLDTAAPTAPTTLDLASDDDTGSSNSDNITTTTTNLTITGCAEANSTVELFKDDTAFSTPVTDTADGSTGCTAPLKQFSANIDLSAQSSAYDISAKATDTAGNTSAASTDLSITVDGTAPTVANPSFTTSNSNSSYAKQSDTITISIDFSEEIDENNTTIKYQVGSGTETDFTYTTDATIDSGECKETTDSTDIYTCKYTVGASDDGLFKTKVSAFKDVAGNAGTAQSYNSDGVTADTTDPTVSSIAYKEYANGSGDSITNWPLNGTVYSIVTFSEDVIQAAANDSTAKPSIWYKTSASATEVQYDIISSGNLATGDCKAITGTSVYSCMYTGSGLSGTNLFKTYSKGYSDLSGNSGDAQSYSTNAGGVTLSANAPPSLVYTPSNAASINDNTVDITITASSTIYADSTGTAFTDDTIDDIITLKEDDSSGDAIAFGATISGNVITIDPDSNLEDGVVYAALSSGWYYGVNPTKTQGTASHASFTVDTAAPAKPTTLDLASDDDTGASDTDNITKTTTHLTITGCAEANSTVEIFKDDTAFSTPVTDIADGSTGCTAPLKQFSVNIDLSAQSSPYDISAKATDAASNTSAASTDLAITVDGTAPTITTTVAGTNDNRTVSATDNESGTTMERKIITSGTTCNASTMSSGTTAYTEGGDITIAAADNGKKVCFSSTDAAGNSTYTATAALVTGSGLTATVGSIPTGSAKSKDITISSVTTGAAVKYKIITNSTCNATNYGTGGTTVTLSSNAGTVTVTNELDNAKYLCFKVTKTNFSDHYVASAQITGIDDTAPTAPSAITNKTTSPNNDTTPTFTVTVAETGGSVILYSDSSCTSANAVSSATNVTDNTSPYKVDVTTNAYSTDGTKTVYAQHTDEATNTSSCSTATGTYTLDTAAPTAPTTLDLASDDDTGSSNSDNITTTTTNLTITGCAEANSTVELFKDDTAFSTPVTDTADGSTGCTAPLKQFSANIDLSAQSSAYDISAKATDTAGNTSAASTDLSITVDGTAPTITTTVSGTPTNRSVSATDNDSGTTTMLYKLIDGTDTCDATEMSSGTTAYTEGSSTTITGASNNGKKACFSSTDVAGNTAYTATAALTVAGGAPTTTWTPANNGYLTNLSGSITLVFGSDVYSNNTCTTELTNTTADNAVTLGTTNANNNIATTVTYTAATNTITVTPDADLTDNTTYYAGVTNAWYYQNGACAQGVAESISFTTDTTPPSLTISSVSGGYVNASEDDSGVTVSGTTTNADSTSDVDLTFTNGSNTTTISNISVSSNTWTTTLTLTQLTALTEGTISISGTVDDRAGNTSTATQSFVYDITAPTLTISAVSGGYVNATEDNSGVTVSGTTTGADTGSDVDLTFTNGSNTTTISDISVSSNAWTTTLTLAQLTTLTEGTISISGTVDDSAGNTSTAATQSFTYDATAPTITTGIPNLAASDDTGVSSTDNITKNTTNLSFSGTLSGAATTGDIVQLYSGTNKISGATDASFTGANSRDWEIHTSLTAGSHSVKAVVVDTAGNEGTQSTGLSVTVDTAAPTITTTVSGTPANRSVSATDNDSGTTTWKYKLIDGTDTCDATEMTNDTESYTEGSSKSVTGASNNGKKACFSSTDVAGNTAYIATAALAIAGGAPTTTWTPANNGYLTSLSGSITLVFGSDVYSNSSCTTELTNTTADNAVTLGTTNANNNIATTVTYTASTNTITITPDSNLTDNTTYYAGVTNAWYYQNGACAQGAAESISFTTDATAPTVSSITYNSQADGNGATLTNLPLNGTVYSIITFSEPVAHTVANDTTATPGIWYKTSASAAEVQYDIIASGTLATGDCKNIGTNANTNKVYSCRYTGASLSNTNLFKSYIKTYTDQAGNTGTAQSYTTNANGVTFSTNAAPSITYTPANNAYTNDNTINITIGSTSALYSNATGTTFTNSTIDDIITLKETNASGDDIDFGATISGNTITIDPDNALADGVVYVAISNAWYYGVNPTKTQGTASHSTFTVDTAAPTLTISAVSGGYVNASEDSSGVTVSGTTTGADSGSDVDLTFTNSSNTQTISDIAVSSNAWTTTLTFTQLTALTEGTISISGTVDDSAGNTATATQSFVYDTTAPVITTTVGGTNDNRTVSASDNESGTTMQYKIITAGTTCNASALSGASTYTESSTLTISAADNGKKVCFSSTDAAGNSSYTATAALSTGSVLTATVGSVPTGSAKSKDITISSVTSGATVKYKVTTSSSCNATNYVSGGTTVTLSGNSGTVTVTNETDNNKYLCFKVTKTNFSDHYVGSAQITGIDDTAPTAPSAITNKTTSPNNDTTPTFTVTVAETGGTVTLYSDSTCTTAVSSATTVTDNTSPYKVDVTTNAYSTDGTKTVYAQHTDEATNTSSCSTATGTYTLDTAAPTAPTTLDLASDDDTGSSNSDNITTTTTNLTITGCAEANSTVELFKDDTAFSTPVTDTADGSTGCTAPLKQFSANIDLSAQSSAYDISAKATDTAGNTSAASTDLSITVDGTAPTITTTIAGTPTNRSVSATDNDAGTTTMLYKLIDGTDTCDSTEMANDTESYTEGGSKTITGASNNGKKACFSSTDVAGNTAYIATAALAIAGGAPTTTWTPANNGYLTSLSGSITLVFGSDVYSNSSCTTELTNTTADNAVTLGTTNANNNIATTVTYTASTNTITITPDSNLTDNTTYYAGVTNAWYYQNGACAQGAAESISFTTDATAPTVSSITYNSQADGNGATLTNLPLNGTVYSIITFSEPVAHTVANDTTATPGIWYKTSASAAEVQYDIIASGTLATGDCKNIGTNANTNKVYSCRYTGASLSNTNLFKSYIKTYTDQAGNTGTAQSYTTNANGVTFSTNAAPSITYTPANNAYTNDNTINITIGSTSALYSNATGTTFTNSTIDDIITLKETNASGDDIDFGATISGNTITIDPDNALADGVVYVAISNAWYYGVNPTKTQGTASHSTFTVDTAAPTATITGAPSGTNNTTTLAVTVAGTSVTHYKHKTVTGTTCTATGYGSETAIATTITDDISSLADGSIILCVLGRDTAGNWQTVASSATWTKDVTTPTITTTVGGTNDNRTVSASDNDAGTTTMQYKIITSGTSCNATTMSSGTTAYTEGSTLTISAADNGKKVCFSSEDSAGNTAYTATAALVTGSGLTATVGSVPTGSAQSKDITISSVTSGAIVKYKIITNSTCNATNYGSGGTTVTLSSNSGTVTVTNESDNTKYLCFKVTKTNFADHYVGSAQITGIDDTAPTATITGAPSGTNNTTTLAVTVAGTSVTHYKHKTVTGTTCTATGYGSETAIATSITDDISSLADGSIILCVLGRDTAGNWQSTATSATWTKDATAPTITTTVAGTPTNRSVSATDNDSGTTTMLYKLIDGTDTCDATEMSSGTTAYTEGSSKSVTGASNNGKKACFSSTDVAGNTAYTATAALAIAGGAPSTTWTPANNGYLTNLSGTITLVFGSDVYSNNTCTTELTNTTADNAVTLGTTNANNNVATTVTYTAASNTITITPDADLTDNTTYYAGVTNAWYYQNGACAQGAAESISFTTDATAPTLTIFAVSGGYVNASEDDSGVTISGTTTNADSTSDVDLTFTNGSNTTTISNITVSSNAWTTTLTLTQLTALTEGIISISGTVDDRAGNTSTATQSFVYDSTAPTITTTVGGTNDNRTVSASDNDSGTTTMKYKLITSGTTCNASTMSSGTTTYTESNTLTIAAADNGKKVCFSSTDSAGNTSYTATATLSTGSGLTASVGSVPTGSAKSKDITISSVTTGAAVQYKIITNSTCNATNYGSGGTAVTLSSNSGTVTVTNESDNTKYLCFKVTKTNFADHYVGSAQITGIDDTAPTATLSGAPSGTSGVTTLAVTVAGTDVTHYKHKTVTGTTCTATGYGSETAIATSITDDISSLADGSIILCVLGRDTAGNWQTVATSATWTKDATAPTLTIAAVSGGYVNASEDDSGVTISGTTTNTDAGSDVDLTFSNGSNIVTISDIAVSSNAWTTTLTPANLTALTVGTISISGTVDDTAGNTSAAATRSFVYDITAPTVTTTIGGVSDTRTVSATDNDTGTTMRYKIITTAESCDATEMSSGTTVYTEGVTLTMAVADNGKKVCFSSTDTAGNGGYGLTGVLAVSAPLSATVGAVPAGSVHVKNITISSVTAGATVTYNLITNSSCNATNYGSGGTAVTLSGNAGTVTVTHESDNTKYLCFKVTKAGFSDQYFGSTQITGIDDTAPTPPSSIVGSGLFGNDTTPSFTVTMTEGGGSVVLYSDSACTTAASAVVTVTDTTVPYTVSVTANALSGDGERTYYAEHTDAATHRSGCSSVFASYTLDTVLPVITTTVGGVDTHREVSAVDDDSGTTAMRYNLIAGSAVCGASTMGIRASSYTEGEVITLSGSRKNGKKMCFSSRDAAGNTAYAATAPLTVAGPNPSHGSGALFAGEYIHFDEVNAQSKKEHIIHRPGDTHPEIKQVQILLNRTPCKVSETGPGSFGEETEFFGAKTHDALFCFQKEVGINQTGVFDPPTRYALLGIPTGEVKAPEAAHLVQSRITALKDRLLILLKELRTKLLEKETGSSEV